MSKGADTSTTTNSAQLPDYIKPYVERFLPKAEAISTQPYQPYGGQRLADFSPDTQAAFGMVRQNAADPLTGLTQAQQTAGGLANYQAGNIGTTDWTGANVQGYMNPYIQNVLDVQKQRANQNFQEQQAARDAAAIQAGAFGGSRRFVQDMAAQRDTNQQLQAMEAEGLANAYQQAQNMFTSDQGRMLQAQMANEEARRLGSAFGLDAARTQADLTQKGYDLRNAQAEALSSVGAKEQQRQQAGLDLAYQDYIRQQEYPYTQLQRYQSLLGGGPAPSSQTTTTSTPPPDFLSQLIGLGVTGAGIWDMFN
jgi:hypothetical protein